jgi:hypothetical protein
MTWTSDFRRMRKDDDLMKSYPLQWPSGWRRTKPEHRTRAKFNKKTKESFSSGNGVYYRSSEVTIAEGSRRVLKELMAFGVEEGDAIISTNLKLRLDGLPKSDQAAPADPGVAVYWQRTGDQQHKSMAIDRYDRVADNLAAIAATLDAMRAIERHGGAMILERAFLGFQCLPAPNTWRSVLGVEEDAPMDLEIAKSHYKKLSLRHHPDCGGTEAKMSELNWAMEEAERELS